MGILYTVCPDRIHYKIPKDCYSIKDYNNIYKVGMSFDNNPTRIKSYGKDAKIILLATVINNVKLEKIFIEKINKQIGKPIIGREYFRCNDDELIKLKKIFIDVINMDSIFTNNVFFKIIEDRFPRYYEDICFGGDKKLVLFNYGKVFTYGNKKEMTINYYFIDRDDDKIILKNEELYINCNFQYYYWKKLKSDNIICNKKTYDLNNPDFLKSIHNSIKKINVTLSPENIKKMNKIQKEIDETNSEITCFIDNNIMWPDLIINNKYYGSFQHEDEKHMRFIADPIYHLYTANDLYIDLIKINNEWYDEKLYDMFLRICPRCYYKKLMS